MPEQSMYPIERNLTNHPPGTETQKKMEKVRAAAKDLANDIDTFCPTSREKSLAFTNLEQTVMWAMASLARADYDANTTP